jgi:hypothetical protein
LCILYIREERREDQLAEAGTVEAAAGGIEIKKVFVPVGAETERQQLERLLRRRAEFTGQPLDDDDEDEYEEHAGDSDAVNRYGDDSAAPYSDENCNAGSHGGGNKPPNQKEGKQTGVYADKSLKTQRNKQGGKARVIGFGKQMAELYGVGEKYDAAADLTEDNTRFADEADEAELPAVVRARAQRIAKEKQKYGGNAAGAGGGAVGEKRVGADVDAEVGAEKGLNGDGNGKMRGQWISGTALENDPGKLEQRAKKVNRSKLVYSGLSA